MTLSFDRIKTVAVRDYLAAVRRRAFFLTMIGTPLLYALLMFIVIKPQQSERVGVLRAFHALGVVDSSGLFQNAPDESWAEVSVGNPFADKDLNTTSERHRTAIRRFPDFASAQAEMERDSVTEVLVIPPDYETTGHLRRYAKSNNLFSVADERVVSRWIVSGLLAGRVDSASAERAAQPLRSEVLYTRDKQGGYEARNDAREILDFLLPFVLGLLLGLAIVIGGQYLLQGVNEEKESRILESMLCNVTPEELLAGKLIGLGGAGLTLVFGWLVLVGSVATPMLGMVHLHLPPGVIAVMIVYFLLGYLFYGSLMTGIGAIASNMREAQQISVWCTMLTFIPFYLLPTLIGHPDAPLAVALSMIPPTAPVSTMLRLAAPGSSVPPWQIAVSILLLAGSAWLVLLLSARLFRIGMLMYGKTPNLPEILRWMRQP
jgi:ABC-2 type transport system permease protein